MNFKVLPRGSYAIVATVNTEGFGDFHGGHIRTVNCNLFNDQNVIGGTTDRRVVPEADEVSRSLSMNGGAEISNDFGTITIKCSGQGAEDVEQSQMMIMQTGVFPDRLVAVRRRTRALYNGDGDLRRLEMSSTRRGVHPPEAIAQNPTRESAERTADLDRELVMRALNESRSPRDAPLTTSGPGGTVVKMKKRSSCGEDGSSANRP